jgi:hypothetical protein
LTDVLEGVMTAEAWFALLLWAVPSAFLAWSWRGRSSTARWWVGNSLEELLVRGVIPSWVLVAVSVFVVAVADGSRFEAAALNVATVGVVAGAALFLWALLPVPLPRWWAPKWFRTLSAQQAGPRTSDAFGATVALADLKPEVSSEDLVPDRWSEVLPVGSWRGSYVYDPDMLSRAHGLAGRGMVAGKLLLFADGLIFVASATEDALRGEPTTVEIPQDRVTDVRVVAARAGADGVPRRGLSYRSMWPRLVVFTERGNYVFEVTRASRVAGTVTEALLAHSD